MIFGEVKVHPQTKSWLCLCRQTYLKVRRTYTHAQIRQLFLRESANCVNRQNLQSYKKKLLDLFSRGLRPSPHQLLGYASGPHWG